MTIQALRTRVALRTIILATLGTCLQAATYYVSPAGADDAPGTSLSTPWRTLLQVNKAKLLPGDTVLLEGGASFQGFLWFDQSIRGTAEKPITISSYGTGPATIAATQEDRGITAIDTSGFHISNLNIVGNPSATGKPDGILFYTELAGNVKLPYIVIDKVTVSNFRGLGINIGSWNGKTGYTDVRITNVTLYSNAMGGMSLWGKDDVTQPGWAHRNVYVGSSKAYNNSGIAGMTRSSGSGFTVGDTDGGKIEYSVAYNNGWLNTNHAGPVGIWAYNVNRFTIQYNEAYGNRTASGADGGGFDLDGGSQYSVMQYNYSHDNDGPGYLLCQYSGARPHIGNVVRYNISQNDARRNGVGAIHLYSAIANAAVYNNTVYVSGATTATARAVFVQSPTANTWFRNNTLVSTVAAPLVEVVSGQYNLRFNGNNYWAQGAALNLRWGGQIYSTLPALRAGTGQERLITGNTGISADPGLVAGGSAPPLGDAHLLNTLDQYRLPCGAASADAGVQPLSVLIGSATADFFGIKLPQGAAYDIGASEAVCGTASVL